MPFSAVVTWPGQSRPAAVALSGMGCVPKIDDSADKYSGIVKFSTLIAACSIACTAAVSAGTLETGRFVIGTNVDGGTPGDVLLVMTDGLSIKVARATERYR